MFSKIWLQNAMTKFEKMSLSCRMWVMCNPNHWFSTRDKKEMREFEIIKEDKWI